MIYSVLASFILGFLITLLFTIPYLLVYRQWGLKGCFELFESQMMVNKILVRHKKDKLNIFGVIMHGINGGLLAIPLLLFHPLIQDETTNIVLFGSLLGLLIWLLTLAPVHRIITRQKLYEPDIGFGPIVISICYHSIYAISLILIFKLLIIRITFN